MTEAGLPEGASAGFESAAKYRARTFEERGVAVPFTAPGLGGARVRRAAANASRVPRRAAVELIVPNPSGGPGVYILPWKGVVSVFQPTVHDSRLCQRINEAPVISPSMVRKAARKVLLEGLAGPAARAAAEAAESRDAAEQLVANYTLLLNLVGQVEQGGIELVASRASSGQPPNGSGLSGINGLCDSASTPVDIERRSKRAIARLAPVIDQKPEMIAATLERIAGLMAPIGIGQQAASARLARDLAALTGLGDQAREWAGGRGDDAGLAAHRVGDAADATISRARPAFAEARALALDVIDLIRRWFRAPVEITRCLARAEWLLDGWPDMAALWASAQTDSRDVVMPEMMVRLPILPGEAFDDDCPDQEADAGVSLRRDVPANTDWRTGVTVFDLIHEAELRRAESENAAVAGPMGPASQDGGLSGWDRGASVAQLPVDKIA